MIKATKEFFTRYADFKGRTSRADYWWAFLGVFLITFVVYFICALLGADLNPSQPIDLGAYFSNIGNIIYVLYDLAFIIPIIAISVRRLHDINKSGWWYLLNCIPFVGEIVLFIFYLLPSVNEGNRY